MSQRPSLSTVSFSFADKYMLKKKKKSSSKKLNKNFQTFYIKEFVQHMALISTKSLIKVYTNTWF